MLAFVSDNASYMKKALREILAGMKCTKVPGTLARTYANEHECIFNYHVWH